MRILLLTFCILVTAFPARAQTDGPIRVGTTQSLTGPYQEFGIEQLRGLQMWVRDINTRGSLLGRPVELVYYDDGSSAARSAGLYKKLIGEDRVDLLVGPYSSEITLAATTVAEASNFPILTAAASADELWDRGYRNVIGIDVPAGNYLDLAIEVAANQGAETLALVAADSQFGTEVAVGARTLALKRGLSIVLDERYKASTRDFSALANRLAGVNADVILGISYLDDSVALVRALKAAAVRPKLLGFTVGPALFEFGEQLGADAEGVVGVVQWLPGVRLPGAQDFAYRYRRLYGHTPAVYAALGYATGQVLEAAVRLAQATAHDAVRQQLLTMEFGSLLGQFQVDASGRQVGKKNYLLQWQQGERRLVEPKDIAESMLRYPLP